MYSSYLLRRLSMGLVLTALVSGIATQNEASADSHAVKAPGPDASVVEKRVYRFKQNGADIQAVFKQHLPAEDYTAIEAVALRMAAWSDEIPAHFPTGSTSAGAKDEIWQNFPDFKAKAEAAGTAARALKATAGSSDKAMVAQAAKALGGTCKSCHQSYRIKK